MIVQKSASACRNRCPGPCCAGGIPRLAARGKPSCGCRYTMPRRPVLYALDQVTDDGRNAYGEKFALGLSVCGKLVLSVRFHGHDSTAKLLLWVARVPTFCGKWTKQDTGNLAP